MIQGYQDNAMEYQKRQCEIYYCDITLKISNQFIDFRKAEQEQKR